MDLRRERPLDIGRKKGVEMASLVSSCVGSKAMKCLPTWYLVFFITVPQFDGQCTATTHSASKDVDITLSCKVRSSGMHLLF